MATYAKQTTVSADRSLTEIRNIVKRYGAKDFAYLERDTLAAISFVTSNRHVRFAITLPNPDDRDFTHTLTGQRRSVSTQATEHEKAVRQRWRALGLVIKAKLEAVESQIATLEQEFFPYLVLPGGRTVFEQVGDQVMLSIDSGEPPLLQIEG
ncbi:hypothetical protein EDF62_1605 [Leucobacter luti]|uniref:Uncharacterized protein n=1 Tax=Leucobacter luti TaxID=340320 RepID=A0A4V3CY14_9MICO|nr:hypothetical protein [Leucobacter luti]TDP92398.1 hypothetical protein EDF62_1605 [Leucobacter luti]